MKKLLLQVLCTFLLIGFVKSNAQFQHSALRSVMLVCPY